VLASVAVAARRLTSFARARAGAALGPALAAVAVLGLVASPAARAESLDDLRDRMARIQDDLDDATSGIEELRTRAEDARRRIGDIRARTSKLDARADRLEQEAGDRADALYRDGGTEMLEVLLSADDLSELSDRTQLLSAVSLEDSEVFVRLSRSKLELEHLARQLADQRSELVRATEELQERSRDLQDRLEAASADYDALKARLERRAHREAFRDATAPAVGSVAAPVPGAGGMTCPVAGPVSFVDSWGSPRDGHVHQGVDMMAAYGTPVVAVVSGTITYAAYDGSGGNMIFLSGDDGNAYWYMHNQSNLVTGGHVSSGRQIATVGDTGNAEGTPHVHFEFHPGGGGPVDPYPLVASIC
jgi:peptidoglycan LD-endopeptidase LytH